MKSFRINLLASVVVCFLVFLLSCRVQETDPVRLSDNGINMELVNEVTAISDAQLRKVAFTKILSNDEKLYVFKKRIADKKVELSLTPAQQKHLDVLVDFMPNDLYSNTAKKAERIAYLNSWMAVGKQIFEEDVLNDIVASVSAQNSKVKPMRRGAVAPCECSRAQDFCGSDYQCTLLASCNEPGCGIFLLSTCNGTCDPIPKRVW